MYHQYCAFQDSLTQGLRYYNQKHKYQYKAEHQESHTKLYNVKENMREEMNPSEKNDATKEIIEEKKRHCSDALNK